MPNYCYKCPKCGRITEKVRPIPRRDDPVACDCGADCHRHLKGEMGQCLSTPPGNWPMHSYAAGVAPHQREEAYEASKRMGVPTRFDKNGDAIFRDPQHRKEYCEAKGLFDRNAGHKDPKPQRT